MAAAELEIRSSYMRWAPVISGFGRLHAFNYAGFYTNENYVWSLGVLIDWQVYDGGLRDARRHLAESVRTENAVKLSSLGDTIFNDLTMAQQSIETKLRGLESAERRVVLTNKAFEILRIQHTAGVAPQIDLLIAQDALINAEVDASRARFELALAEIAFRKAAGLLPYK
jgi:outer membrane protein TolC